MTQISHYIQCLLKCTKIEREMPSGNPGLQRRVWRHKKICNKCFQCGFHWKICLCFLSPGANPMISELTFTTPALYVGWSVLFNVQEDIFVYKTH
jgi:hypothetical protein